MGRVFEQVDQAARLLRAAALLSLGDLALAMEDHLLTQDLPTLVALVLAGALAYALGLHTGGPLLGGAFDNPRGFFERSDVIAQVLFFSRFPPRATPNHPRNVPKPTPD